MIPPIPSTVHPDSEVGRFHQRLYLAYREAYSIGKINFIVLGYSDFTALKTLAGQIIPELSEQIWNSGSPLEFYGITYHMSAVELGILPVVHK